MDAGDCLRLPVELPADSRRVDPLCELHISGSRIKGAPLRLFSSRAKRGTSVLSYRVAVETTEFRIAAAEDARDSTIMKILVNLAIIIHHAPDPLKL